MNPQKRQRRAMVRREVAPEVQQPIRRRRKGVAEGGSTEATPEQQPKQRTRRRTLPPGTKAEPAWRVAGSAPYTSDPEEETDDVTGD